MSRLDGGNPPDIYSPVGTSGMHGRVMEEASGLGWCGCVLDSAGFRRLAVQRIAFSLTVFWGLLTHFGVGVAVEPQPMAGLLTHLKTVERQLLPGRLIDGEPRCDAIVDYYWDANPELASELKSAKFKLSSSDDDHQRMILVAGPAGVGKTFIKRGVCEGLPKDALWKFDVRELFGEYRDRGLAKLKADLRDGSTVFNEMLTLTPAGRRRFRSEVLKCTAGFVVVDSLDEIHPRDYVFVLQTLGSLVDPSRKGFAQVVVFGRPFCFEAYWQWHQHERSVSSDCVRGFMLRKPKFRTTGDIQVSNWNFDCWKFGLCRKSVDLQQVFCFSDYQRWCERGFSCEGEFSDLVFEPNRHMTVQAREMLNRWISEEPTVAAVISNLAANGMVRDILVEQLQMGKDFDERHFMDQFLKCWLERDTRSDDRPSQIKPEHLDVYLNLLENVAVMYSQSVQADGSFAVVPHDQVQAEINGGFITVSVKDLLNRSGLVTAEQFGSAKGRVRFEPLWLQRLLISKHARRRADEDAKQTPVALR